MSLKRWTPFNKRWKKRATFVKQTAKENKTWTSIWGLWVFMGILALVPKSIVDEIPKMMSVYHYLGGLAPTQTSDPLYKIAYANLLFWPFVGMFMLLRNLYRIIRRVKPEVIVEEPLVLYKEELATTINAIDEDFSKQSIVDAVEELLGTVVETVALNLGLRSKDYRMYFVVPMKEDQPTSESKAAGDTSSPKTKRKQSAELTAFRYGKTFQLATKNKISDEEFEDILTLDRKRVDVFLHDGNKTESYTQLKNQKDGATVLMFARNPGYHLRMGLYVAVTKEEAVIEDFEEIFPNVAQIVSTLGFIDRLVEIVREYKKGKE